MIRMHYIYPCPPRYSPYLDIRSRLGGVSSIKWSAYLNGSIVFTICPRSSYPSYIVTYYIKLVTTSRTVSKVLVCYFCGIHSTKFPAFIHDKRLGIPYRNCEQIRTIFQNLVYTTLNILNINLLQFMLLPVYC